MEPKKPTAGREEGRGGQSRRRFRIEPLEERIAPSVNGTGGYEGQPGNQNSAHGNPSGSANPEH